VKSANFAGMVTVTKIFSFDVAHALDNYPGKCRHIHGHTYSLHVTVIGELIDVPGHPYDGMIIDFTDLKQWVNTQVVIIFDHALVIRKNGLFDTPAIFNGTDHRVIISTYQPTCENMLLDMADRLLKSCPNGITIKSLRLYETPTSYAEWIP
jgi:6-pyruvoyltetrahydropterin/6-carboxytetrahydropterin synthase